VRFGTLVDMTLHLGSHIPPKNFGGVNKHFQAKLAKSKTCMSSKLLHRFHTKVAQLHNNKDYQVLFVGGLNTRTTNPRWRTAAILKIEKSRYLGNCLTDQREMLQGDTL